MPMGPGNYLGREAKRYGVRAPAPQEGTFLDRAEALIGVDPMNTLAMLSEAQGRLASLREDEAEIASEAASYEARFGYPSHFEHERKNKLDTLIEQRRNEAYQKGE